MKLASLKHGRDGRLVVVSDDLAWCSDASLIAPTLQAALDDWAHAKPKLEALAPMTARRRNVSTNANAPRRCRAPINGRMVRPM